mmetsp:Transcript_7573/g.46592  ORF Transcript_7573/g.46592 Transcript_7573/m.46592 type:complete len:223 (-) Transcript_7573:215-883(-)
MHVATKCSANANVEKGSKGVVANRRNPAKSCRTNNALRAVRVDRQCASEGRPDELHRRGGSGVATFLATCVASATLLGAPLDASAVVGGKGNASTPLSGLDLSNQDLRNNDYTKSVLKQTKFDGSNLTGVSFFACFAKGATFQGANLSLADLEQGDFEGANFTNAVLEGAFVNAANFTGIELEGSDWTDVVLRKDVYQQLCAVASGTNPTTGVDTRDSLSCG